MFNCVMVEVVTLFRFLAHTACGRENIGHLQRDQYNYINKLRTHQTGCADDQNVKDMLQQRQLEDPEFFYKALFDEESRLSGLFWTDYIMKEDYKLFGDVLVFDTTFRTNKYDMICAPFVGANNHWRNAMFGCAFLANETTETFTWLLETFLSAMDNKKPVTVFIDQDAAMAKAIEQVTF